MSIFIFNKNEKDLIGKIRSFSLNYQRVERQNTNTNNDNITQINFYIFIFYEIQEKNKGNDIKELEGLMRNDS